VLASTAQAAWSGRGDIGVSGVVYACVGALLVVRWRGPALSTVVRAATIVLLAWLVIGIIRGALGVFGIGNMAHLAGLAVGLALGAFKGRGVVTVSAVA
jgi:membrane associated rhomboid family serine protease